MKNFSLCLLLLQSATVSHAFAPRTNAPPRSSSSEAAPLFAAKLSNEPDSVVQSSSARRFLAAGEIEVDMNKYNLELDDIVEQWTASLHPATPMQEEGVYLGAQDKDRILVDTLKVEVLREEGKGLGLELLELAGGRDDGLGIVVVSGFVDGGIAANCGLLEGDSITKLAVKKTSKVQTDNSLTEMVEEFATPTECLGFDGTVEAIGSLPPIEGEGEIMSLTIKRLRRKPKISVKLQYPPEQNEPDVSFELFSGENLRRALLVKGTKLNDALSRRFDSGGTGDCGAEGTCATCVVSIVRGEDLLNPKGLTEQQILQKNPRWRMACKTIVGYGMREGELIVRVNPRQW